MRGPVEYIRANLNFFFRTGEPSATALTNMVIEDALEAGAADIRVLREGAFVGVFANVDWMESRFADFSGLFKQIVSIGKERPNGFRAETVLIAVTSGVAVGGSGPAFMANLAEEDLPAGFRDLATRTRRSLMWRFDGNRM